MQVDGRSLDGVLLETDVCVVGAGPAGTILSAQFLDSGADVTLIESGGLTWDPAVQSLNEGETIGDRYAGLHATRHRQVGGTATLWNTLVGSELGAKYTPLDPADLTLDSEVQPSGWPLDWDELEPWYRTAQSACELGAFDYGGISWAGPHGQLLPLTGTLLETRVYQLGRAVVFTEKYPQAIRRSSNVQLCHDSTVVELRTDQGGERIEEVLVASLDGARFRVRAHTFVLAAGAIENARLLLLWAAANPLTGFTTSADWVGRCFMEHPRDHALALVPSRALFDEAAFYDSHVAPGGVHVAGRVALTEAVRRDENLPNASVTLVPRPRQNAWQRTLGRRRNRYPNSRTHWSADAARPAFEAFILLMNLEQLPHPENRVALATRRDRLGLPAAELHWRWREEDQTRLERVRAVIARELTAAGLGRIESTPRPPDPNGHHHSGTTRMSIDPELGVVDPTGRVHGIENLYVCGASLFPRAGFANPTLTIVALALRLAAHLGAPAGTPGA